MNAVALVLLLVGAAIFFVLIMAAATIERQLTRIANAVERINERQNRNDRR